MTSSAGLTINGRQYVVPTDPVVVVCVDGSEPAYHEHALAHGRMPALADMLATDLRADAAMPSFTNPNNVSIATGAPPSVHGICGNFWYDRTRGAEVLMNDPAFLRAPTIFAEFAAVGVDVAVVTAKDKLRALLGHGLSDAACFSAECADDAALALVGRPRPDVYSADLSEFVLAAGVALLERRRPLLTYLSLTDYVQHKYAPGTPEADEFYAMIDRYLGQLHALGAVVLVTGDHGMNAKTGPDGAPNVVYLQQYLDTMLGPGRTRVILPITDPYVVHHGALGSFAFVYTIGDGHPGGEDGNDAEGYAHAIAATLAELPGVAEVLSRAVAVADLELPPDRSGDLTVIAARDTVLGTSPDRHDLGQLDRPLRSHGGRTEQRVPFLANRPMPALPSTHRLRNFDAFAVATRMGATPRPTRESGVARRY